MVRARGWSEQPVTQSSAKLVTPIGEVAAELIGRRYRKARKRSRNFVDLPPHERHVLRIGLKKLRYTIDLLEPLFAKRRTRPFVKRLKGLQDDLGHANDVNAARNLLADVANGQHVAALDRASGIVLGWHDRGLAEQEARLCANVHRFRQAKPFGDGRQGSAQRPLCPAEAGEHAVVEAALDGDVASTSRWGARPCARPRRADHVGDAAADLSTADLPGRSIPPPPGNASFMTCAQRSAKLSSRIRERPQPATRQHSTAEPAARR